MAASADKKFEAASTLVMGYYFYRYIKNNPLHNAALIAIMRKYYPGWAITASVPGGGLTAMLPTLNPESQAIAKRSSTRRTQERHRGASRRTDLVRANGAGHQRRD